MRRTQKAQGIRVAIFAVLLSIAGLCSASRGDEAGASAADKSSVNIRLIDPATSTPIQPSTEATSPGRQPTRATRVPSSEPASASGSSGKPADLPTMIPASKPAVAPNRPEAASLPVSAGKSPAEVVNPGLTVDSKPQEPLKPVPQPGPEEIEAASFKGVAPGTSTVAELQKSWGKAKEVKQRGPMEVHLYAIPPFNQVEVVTARAKVASLVIRFEKPFPAGAVAEQLELSRIRPVLISNEVGEILGQSYPERGVVLLFEPDKEKTSQPSMRVMQIVLEPITAEPFILRAESNLELTPAQALDDLDKAIKVQKTASRAHWLRSRILAARGDLAQALQASKEALRLDPENAQYRVTQAQILGQKGEFSQAIQETQKAAEQAERRPHIKARALCLWGDLLASSTPPDYREAMNHHGEAIRLADSLAEDQYPAIRIAAKEVLLDAHLGAAHDIAWGAWKEKDKAVGRWLDRAKELVSDLIEKEGASETLRFRTSTRALAVCVGARGIVDPTSWADETLRLGRQLIGKTSDPIRKAQYQGELGMALYDALQVYQVRGDHNTAIKYAELAIEALQQSSHKQTPSGAYLLGRLYFRVGAVYALRDKNHEEASAWFDKALPLLEKPLPPDAQAEIGRHGETFISIGVSFWEKGRREKALELSQRGVGLMEQAVKMGLLDDGALAVAYSNLAIMHRQLGQSESATRYEEMATRIRKTAQADTKTERQ